MARKDDIAICVPAGIGPRLRGEVLRVGRACAVAEPIHATAAFHAFDDRCRDRDDLIAQVRSVQQPVALGNEFVERPAKPRIAIFIEQTGRLTRGDFISYALPS